MDESSMIVRFLVVNIMLQCNGRSYVHENATFFKIARLSVTTSISRLSGGEWDGLEYIGMWDDLSQKLGSALFLELSFLAFAHIWIAVRRGTYKQRKAHIPCYPSILSIRDNSSKRSYVH